MKRLLLLILSIATHASIFAAQVADDFVPVDQYSLSIITPLDSLSYKTAVHYAIANDHPNVKFRERGDRGQTNEVLAKYDVLIDNLAYDPNQATPAADIQQLMPIDFTKAENTAQGWARMGTAAIPALTIALNGETRGHASASWRTTYTVTGSGSRNVSLKFRIPETVMDGRFEQSAKGAYQGRAKVQLLVNGYPVWSSEAMRIAPATPNAMSEYMFETFGSAWAFDKNTEKASAKWVTASMGTYSAGQSLDVVLVYFVEASIGRECEYVADMYACMGMTVSFKRDNTATLPSFSSSPALQIAIP